VLSGASHPNIPVQHEILCVLAVGVNHAINVGIAYLQKEYGPDTDDMAIMLLLKDVVPFDEVMQLNLINLWMVELLI